MAWRMFAMAAAGAAMQLGLSGAAFAQDGAGPPGATPEQAELGEFAAPELSPAADRPVLYVTSVEVFRAQAEPRRDIVRVTGLAATGGWSTPQLVPTYAGKPADGIADLQFVASPPRLSQDAGGFVKLEAVFVMEEGHPFNGVRVRGAENALTVKQIPGISETKISVNDCADCVGKKLVQASAAQPAQQGGIREQDLPRLLRVIRPTDGVRGARLNPNRLTLMLGEDDTIVAAFWE